jgi:hypothetical protein
LNEIGILYAIEYSSYGGQVGIYSDGAISPRPTPAPTPAFRFVFYFLVCFLIFVSFLVVEWLIVCCFFFLFCFDRPTYQPTPRPFEVAWNSVGPGLADGYVSTMTFGENYNQIFFGGTFTKAGSVSVANYTAGNYKRLREKKNSYFKILFFFFFFFFGNSLGWKFMASNWFWFTWID